MPRVVPTVAGSGQDRLRDAQVQITPVARGMVRIH